MAVDMVRDSQVGGLFSYGLIFIDLSMPIMDGFEASRQIRQLLNNEFQPMIIAISGHTETEYIEKAWICEIDEFISKPA